MVKLRAAKIQGMTKAMPPLETMGPMKGKVLIIGWGSTYGVIRTVVEALQKEGKSVSFVHCRALNPLPDELAKWVKHFEQVIVVELNLGQLCQIIRAQYLVDAKSIHQVTGKPFSTQALQMALAPYWESTQCQVS